MLYLSRSFRLWWWMFDHDSILPWAQVVIFGYRVEFSLISAPAAFSAAWHLTPMGLPRVPLQYNDLVGLSKDTWESALCESTSVKPSLYSHKMRCEPPRHTLHPKIDAYCICEGLYGGKLHKVTCHLFLELQYTNQCNQKWAIPSPHSNQGSCRLVPTSQIKSRQAEIGMGMWCSPFLEIGVSSGYKVRRFKMYEFDMEGAWKMWKK